MATGRFKPSLVVIVGPTASGKSELALAVAKDFNGEIICADSRTIYKGMNVGTAKPVKKDQQAIPHWGLDLVKPGQRFTAYQFQQYAYAKISEITARGGLPVLVGGAGMYVDAAVFGYSFMPNKSQNPQNLRHRQKGSYKTDSKPFLGAVMVGLNPSPEKLRASINARSKAAVGAGLVEETKALIKRYGRPAVSRSQGIAYAAALKFIDGEISEQEIAPEIATQEWQYARRQKTWFRRNPHISWFESAVQAKTFIDSKLNT